MQLKDSLHSLSKETMHYTGQDMLWLIGSLSHIFRMPFDSQLVRQQFPPPYSRTSLLNALQALDFKVGDMVLDEEGIAALERIPFPVVASESVAATANAIGTIIENGAKRIGLAFNQPLSAIDRITIVIDSIVGMGKDLLKLVTGDQVLGFDTGSITLNATEGQNFISLALLEQGDLSANASATFKAIIERTDASGVVTTIDSNLFTLNIGESFLAGSAIKFTGHSLGGHEAFLLGRMVAVNKYNLGIHFGAAANDVRYVVERRVA